MFAESEGGKEGRNNQASVQASVQACNPAQVWVRICVQVWMLVLVRMLAQVSKLVSVPGWLREIVQVQTLVPNPVPVPALKKEKLRARAPMPVPAWDGQVWWVPAVFEVELVGPDVWCERVELPERWISATVLQLRLIAPMEVQMARPAGLENDCTGFVICSEEHLYLSVVFH